MQDPSRNFALLLFVPVLYFGFIFTTSLSRSHSPQNATNGNSIIVAQFDNPNAAQDRMGFEKMVCHYCQLEIFICDVDKDGVLWTVSVVNLQYRGWGRINFRVSFFLESLRKY